MAGGIAAGFEAGMGWAQKQSGIDIQREQLEQQRREHDEQKRQFNVQRAEKAMSLVERVIQTPDGKYRKALVGNVRSQLEMIGIPLHPLTEAALTDPATAVEFKRALDGVRDLRSTGQIDDDTLARIGNVFGMENAVGAVKDFNEQHEKLKQTRVAGEEARKTQGQGDDAAMKRLEVTRGSEEKIASGVAETARVKMASEQRKELKEDVLKLDDRYGHTIQAATAIRKMRQKGAGSMTPADDNLMLKAFQQFFDTPAVREGEVKLTQSQADLRGQFDVWKSQYVGQKKILPLQVREDIMQATEDLMKQHLAFQKVRLAPLYQTAKDRGLPVNEIFSPMHVRLFEPDPKKVQMKQAANEAAAKQETRRQSVASTIQGLSPENRSRVAQLRSRARSMGISADELIERFKKAGKALPPEIAELFRLGEKK